MARHYSQMERSPSPPPSPSICIHEDHAIATYSCYPQASDRPAGRNISVITQCKPVGTVTSKPKHQDLSRFPVFILCTRILQILVFLLVCAYCICQHLVSCGHCCFFVLFFLNLDFTDLCGFYINMRGGSLGSKLFIGRSIHPLLGTHQKIKMKWFCQLYFYPIGLFHFCHFFFFFFLNESIKQLIKGWTLLCFCNSYPQKWFSGVHNSSG